MSQHDFDIANQGFAAFRADLNNALKALGSLSSGDAEPATTYANQLWYETDTNTLHIRNEANSAWLDLMVINQTTGSPSFNAGGVGIGTNSPAQKLHVDGGGVRIGSTTTSATALLQLYSGTTDEFALRRYTSNTAEVRQNGGPLYIVTTDANIVSIATNNTSRMTIDSAGDVTMTGDVSAANLLSGTYTPTLTAVANVASSTAYVNQYLRVGNMVTVSGHVQLVPTSANTDTQLRMSIPIASNFGTQALGGAGASLATGIFGEPVAITSDTTNDEATFRCRPTTTAGRTYAFSFTYRII